MKLSVEATWLPGRGRRTFLFHIWGQLLPFNLYVRLGRLRFTMDWFS